MRGGQPSPWRSIFWRLFHKKTIIPIFLWSLDFDPKISVEKRNISKFWCHSNVKLGLHIKKIIHWRNQMERSRIYFILSMEPCWNHWNTHHLQWCNLISNTSGYFFDTQNCLMKANKPQKRRLQIFWQHKLNFGASVSMISYKCQSAHNIYLHLTGWQSKPYPKWKMIERAPQLHHPCRYVCCLFMCSLRSVLMPMQCHLILAVFTVVVQSLHYFCHSSKFSKLMITFQCGKGQLRMTKQLAVTVTCMIKSTHVPIL